MSYRWSRTRGADFVCVSEPMKTHRCMEAYVSAEESDRETQRDGKRETEDVGIEDSRKGGEMGKERILISTLKRQSSLVGGSRDLVCICTCVLCVS